MESGLRDKIQVSQDTADTCCRWKVEMVPAREGRCEGKGEMQTYWVAVGFEES
jgi:hypothetical protein